MCDSRLTGFWTVPSSKGQGFSLKEVSYVSEMFVVPHDWHLSGRQGQCDDCTNLRCKDVAWEVALIWYQRVLQAEYEVEDEVGK